MAALGTVLALAGGALALGAFASSRASAAEVEEDETTDDNGGGGMSRRQTMWRKLVALPLTNTQRYFFQLTAYGEGNFNPGAHNKSASERAAARKATANNASLVDYLTTTCGIPLSVLEDGSWGTFQQLGPYFSNAMLEVFGRNAQGCTMADPRRRDVNAQIIGAMYVAWRLGGYDAWQAKPTVGNLRLGWAAPSLMGYLTKNAARLKKYRVHAEHENLPAGIIDAVMGRVPRPTPAMYGLLVNA